MFSETEWMFERQKLYTLMHEHPEWSRRALARAVQHDLSWVRKWAKRFRAQLDPVPQMFRSHSRKPKRSPKQLPEQVKDSICACRERLRERFHRSAGAKTIVYFLKQELAAVPGLIGSGGAAVCQSRPTQTAAVRQ
jgi:hypothetical protein